MRVFRSPALVLLFALVLGAPAAFASPARATAPAARQAAERGSIFHQLRDFLVSLWSPAGCEIDPWGRCLTAPRNGVPPAPTADAGCEMDPLGRCLTGSSSKAAAPPAPTADEGCRMDPLGVCISNP
jgi:hypothetical protein